jgi:hypothetical protein
VVVRLVDADLAQEYVSAIEKGIEEESKSVRQGVPETRFGRSVAEVYTGKAT